MTLLTTKLHAPRLRPERVSRPRLGATLATVGSYSTPAHALYATLGFTDYDLSEPWTRTW